VTIRAVFFDIGETLIDETRIWGEWADWLGVPRLTFFGVLGGLIQRGEPHPRVFDVFRPGFQLEAERAKRLVEGFPDILREEDLYPDALGCLRTLSSEGYRLGLAGNQPLRTEQILREWGLPVDVIAAPEAWGVDKPSPEFYGRLIESAGLPPGEIAYVGDRIDNDVVPAAEAGLFAVFIRRGPWGFLQADWAEAAKAAIRIDSLDALPEGLSKFQAPM
jgi:HAD superfamily hydrolase (TIGR01549 family)